jgi:ABC-2 type transport system permease protein
MEQQTPENEQPFIPPHYMLILVVVGLVVALGVFFTQPTFSVVGWGGLGIAVLSLVAYVLMAPEQAKAALTGRTMRFGGTSLLVTIVLIFALVALYTLVRGLNARVDLTQRDTFSLTQESRQAITAMGADPTVPQIKLYAFYDATRMADHDRDELLFEDFVSTSGGKIAYEFIDPDRSPALADQMGITNSGQIFVARLDETGQPDVENGELVSFISQDGVTNAILKVSADGDFRAYFLRTEGGLDLVASSPDGMSTLNNVLTQQLDWTTRQVGLFDFMSDAGGVQLNDPNIDGEVVIIPGGSKPLTDEEVQILTDYLDNGGNLIILAGPSTNTDETSLSTTPALNDYLWANFGLRFQDNIVIDQTQAWQTPLIPVATDFSLNHAITRSFPQRSGMAFELPHSIEVADPLPTGIEGRYLARSTAEAYAKTDYQAVINNDFERAGDEAVGPFVLAAVAENTTTGARVVLFGSTSIVRNAYAPIASLVNLDAIFNSIVWTTGFDEFFTQINIQSAQRPQDTPMFVDQQTGGMISLVTTFLLPFGLLAIGFLVWWNNREPARSGGN